MSVNENLNHSQAESSKHLPFRYRVPHSGSEWSEITSKLNRECAAPKHR
jgi:hypothetical protein